MSGDGSVVVGVQQRADGSRAGFRWTPEGGFDFNLFNVIVPGGGQQIFPAVISADGKVVAGITSVFLDGFQADRVYRWTESEGVTVLGLLRSFGELSRGFEVHDISADGRVIVGHTGLNIGFRWTVEDGMQPLINAEAYFPAISVSLDGNIVAGYTLAASEPIISSYRWSAETGLRLLGLPPGAPGADTGNMSGDGSVILGWGDFGGPNRLPFIWDEAHGTDVA